MRVQLSIYVTDVLSFKVKMDPWLVYLGLWMQRLYGLAHPYETDPVLGAEALLLVRVEDVVEEADDLGK